MRDNKRRFVKGTYSGYALLSERYDYKYGENQEVIINLDRRNV